MHYDYEIDLMPCDAFPEHVCVRCWGKPNHLSFRIVTNRGNVSGHDDDIFFGMCANPRSGLRVGSEGVSRTTFAALFHLQNESKNDQTDNRCSRYLV